MKLALRFLLIAALGSMGACSTLQRGLVTTAGTAIGAGGGYLLGKDKSSEEAALYTAVGGAGGALLTSLAQGKDQKAVAEGYQAGYQQAQSDSIKRQYWLRQSAEKTGDNSGRLSYYTLPVQNDLGDVKRVPHTVTVPVVE